MNPATAVSALPALPASWQAPLATEIAKPYYQALGRFVATERVSKVVYPPPTEVFSALEATPFPAVRVLVLGQDPYHGPRQAHGMAFSVRPGVAPPPSLVNIFKELCTDLGLSRPSDGYLMPWAQEGVLLLNAVLTVRSGEANSHKNRGWETFTDAIIRALSARREPVAFVLWGAYAGKKAALIDAGRHTIIRNAHPSPLSAHSGFFGSRPFSRINEALKSTGQSEIDWKLPSR